MFESAQGLRQEFADLEKQLADPAVVSDQARSRKVGRRYSELTGVVHALDEHQQLTEDLSAARELANDDPAFAAEADQISARLDEVTDKLTALLAPRDPLDSNDAIMEIKSGEGGEESALFAGDLLNMYQHFAEREGWSTEIIDAEPHRPGWLQVGHPRLPCHRA